MTETPDHPNVELAIRYLDAIAAGATGAALGQYFHRDVVQHEFPNTIVPEGVTRDLAGILEAAERGQAVMRKQHFEIHTAVAVGDRVVLELAWTGTLAIPLGPLPAGTELSAEIATFLTVRDGVIVEQRNYDCYWPLRNK